MSVSKSHRKTRSILQFQDGQIKVKSPDLDKVQRLSELLHKKTYYTSRQLAEVSETINSFKLLADKLRHLSSQSLRRVLELVQI